MNYTNTGGPAFPHEDTMSAALRPGMTLRDYFAAKAMQSLIINTDENSAFEADLWVGNMSYDIADALLKAKNR